MQSKGDDKAAEEESAAEDTEDDSSLEVPSGMRVAIETMFAFLRTAVERDPTAAGPVLNALTSSLGELGMQGLSGLSSQALRDIRTLLLQLCGPDDAALALKLDGSDQSIQALAMNCLIALAVAEGSVNDLLSMSTFLSEYCLGARRSKPPMF